MNRQSRKYGRRYHNTAAASHNADAREFCSRVGGADEIVKAAFFALSGAARTYIFNEYEKRYGENATLYAMKTMPAWQSGRVHMSGRVAERLFALMPPYMPLSQKHEIVKKLWEHYAPASRAYLHLGRDANIDTVVSEVSAHLTQVLQSHAIPSDLESYFNWLAADDVKVKQSLMNHFLKRERDVALASVRCFASELLCAMASDERSSLQRGLYEINIGKHVVELHANRRCSGIRWMPNGEASRTELAARRTGSMWFVFAIIVLMVLRPILLGH